MIKANSFKYNPAQILGQLLAMGAIADRLEIKNDAIFGSLTDKQRDMLRHALVICSEMLRQEHEHCRGLLIHKNELVRQRENEKLARQQAEDRIDQLQKQFDLLWPTSF